METNWELRKLSRTLSSQSSISLKPEDEFPPPSPTRPVSIALRRTPSTFLEEAQILSGQSAKTPFEVVQAQVGVVGPYQLLVAVVTQVGGFIGAVVSGYSADAIGRKPTLVICLLGMVLLNAGLATVGVLNWILTVVMMLVLGVSAGGFMVVNMVLLLETVGNDFWRFATVAFNGWPLGLLAQALIGYLTMNYWGYHIILCGIAAAVTVCVIIWCDESARWLVQTRRVAPAIEILNRTAFMNGRVDQVDFNSLKVNEALLTATASPTHSDSYGYLDLWRTKHIRCYLFALFYSWLASAIISFAIYSLVSESDRFAGNRYLNTAILAVFKQITGLIPFIVATCVGRKVSLLIGVSLTCIACWLATGAFIIFSNPENSVFLTVMGITAAAAIDPIWKVNHLYSMELFPTVVRNMARAVCNTGSRAGSVLAQQVVFLGVLVHPCAPWIIFSLLATGQLIISFLCLPETKGKRLPDQLDDDVFATRTVNVGENNVLSEVASNDAPKAIENGGGELEEEAGPVDTSVV